MGHQFAEIAFTESVCKVQQELGSRNGYEAMQEGDDYNHILGEREVNFIAARDSFYMASVSETGWPYVQHRGGPQVLCESSMNEPLALPTSVAIDSM